jgi:hypothetical protein
VIVRDARYRTFERVNKVARYLEIDGVSVLSTEPFLNIPMSAYHHVTS